MRLVQHSMAFLLALSASAALLWQPAPPAADTAAVQVLSCTQLGNLSWVEMNVQQKQFAEACDTAEANHNWALAYGRRNPQDLAAAVVHDPL